MPEKIENSLLDLDFALLTQRTFTPSPAAWEDQVVYFLLLDRFSDGNEHGGFRDNDGRPASTGTTPLYTPENPGRVDYDVWFRAGGGWQGGTLRGLKSKFGYLRRLGITALWVSPIFRQVAFEPSYHGYGIQNFLDVDPHFGTREEFRDFVQAAHQHGIYIILDIIAHHTGNVFAYGADRYTTHDSATGKRYNDPRWDGKPYAVQGFLDRDGQPTLPFDSPDPARLEAAWPDGAIWPQEFQQPHLFLRKGHITSWDYFPEYAEGDMFDLKTLDLWVKWEGQYRKGSSALDNLAVVYCFWIAYADIDGFRIDAAKHMGNENRLRQNPGLKMSPRTFIFAGKAAPAYYLAKVIIKFINNLAETIDSDPAMRGRIKIVFLPEYRATLAERLIPASDVSNQISTAGYEASGTSNMKFMMNGALTIGTRDGATIEMAEEAGEDNFFLFGLTAEQVADSRSWYNPHWHYENEPETRAALDLIFSGHFNSHEPGIFDPLRDTLLTRGDHYMHLADLKSYLEADQRLVDLYADPEGWARKAILNVAGSGKFSSDRTIAEYAASIWNAEPCPV